MRSDTRPWGVGIVESVATSCHRVTVQESSSLSSVVYDGTDRPSTTCTPSLSGLHTHSLTSSSSRETNNWTVWSVETALNNGTTSECTEKALMPSTVGHKTEALMSSGRAL